MTPRSGMCGNRVPYKPTIGLEGFSSVCELTQVVTHSKTI